MITQTYLTNDDFEICVDVFHVPLKTCDIGIIVFPGLNTSKSGPFFLLSNIAKECMNHGFPVIMFDYYGDGDSSGSYTDVTLKKIKKSVDLVLEYAKLFFTRA